MKKAKDIEVNPKVMFGKPVFVGTRIPVEIILDKLVAGQTQEEILEDYPRLIEEDIKAALSYANKLVKRESSKYVQAITLHKISR